MSWEKFKAGCEGEQGRACLGLGEEDREDEVGGPVRFALLGGGLFFWMFFYWMPSPDSRFFTGSESPS